MCFLISYQTKYQHLILGSLLCFLIRQNINITLNEPNYLVPTRKDFLLSQLPDSFSSSTSNVSLMLISRGLMVARSSLDRDLRSVWTFFSLWLDNISNASRWDIPGIYVIKSIILNLNILQTYIGAGVLESH